MDTRIEIFKDSKWHKLTLREDSEIKYNALINRIGRVDSREISHSNTFSLPPVWNNIQLLGLNVFSPKLLARALNSKYIAKYYVDSRVLQIGFLVINNTNGGAINVNFIDESLEITDKWGSTTYQELLRDEVLPIDVDYAASIAEMRSYDMDKLAILTPLSEIGVRGYNLSLFPNSLNSIGDKFQINSDGVRLDDSFNPYQSRPIFSMKSLFDLATIRYGYTPIFDSSVDWPRVEKFFMINKGQKENKKGLSGIQAITHPIVGLNTDHYRQFDSVVNGWIMKALFTFPQSIGLKPNDIPDWIEDPSVTSYTGDGTPPSYPWRDQYSVFKPDVLAGNVGTIRFTGEMVQEGFAEHYYVIEYWKAAAGGSLITRLSESLESAGISFPSDITIGTDYQIDVTVDKVIFETPPAGASTLVGVQFMVGKSFLPSANFTVSNMQVFETYLPEGVIAFDEFGQYLPDIVDLTHAAPTETVKSLIMAAMHKEGILMNIDSRNKQVKFFSYGAYERERVDGNFSDWSPYFQREDFFPHNTDYGNSYGKINRIGLSSPYRGNTADIILVNQGVDSKYKDFAKNEVGKFKDIQNVKQIANTNTPYFEYTHKGLGLVEYIGNLGTLSQVRAENILGAEVVVNGSFTSDTIWTKGVGWTISINKANKDVGAGALTQSGIIQATKNYLCSFEITDYTIGSIDMYLQGITTSKVSGSAVGTYSGIITTTGSLNTTVTFSTLAGTNFEGSIDNVSIREVLSFQGDFIGLAEIANVNGTVLPDGVKEWYRLVDQAVKVTGNFLIPQQVIKDLDLSFPVYIGELNGFYIIEEVAEYAKETEKVVVKLIKLIDNLRELDEIVNLSPVIVLQSYTQDISGWKLLNNIDFLNYIPASASIKAVQLTDTPANGGIATGFEFNQVITLPPYTGNSVTFNGTIPLGTQEGWYLVKVTDGAALESNEELVYLGDNTPPAVPTVSINITDINDNIPDGITDITYHYNDFPGAPTFATFEFQKFGFISQLPEGPLQTMAFPLTPNTGDVTVNFGGSGFYKITLKTNLADSPPPPIGGGFFIT